MASLAEKRMDDAEDHSVEQTPETAARPESSFGDKTPFLAMPTRPLEFLFPLVKCGHGEVPMLMPIRVNGLVAASRPDA